TRAHFQPDHSRAEMLGRPPCVRPSHALQRRIVSERQSVISGGRELAVGEAPDDASSLTLNLAQHLLKRIRLLELTDRVEVILCSHILYVRREWQPGAVERHDPDTLLARREAPKVPLRHIVMELRRALLACHVRRLSAVTLESQR